MNSFRKQSLRAFELRAPRRTESFSASIYEIRQHPQPILRTLRRDLLRRERSCNRVRVLLEQPCRRMSRIGFYLRYPSFLVFSGHFHHPPNGMKLLAKKIHMPDSVFSLVRRKLRWSRVVFSNSFNDSLAALFWSQRAVFFYAAYDLREVFVADRFAEPS